MKRSLSATTRSRAGASANFSLVPFLAVLLCAMGSLIIVLVILGRHLGLEAARAPVVVTRTPTLSELEAAADRARARISQLKASREKADVQLAQVRAQLGSIEEDSQRLRDQLAQLKSALAHLEATYGGTRRERLQLESELAGVHARIEETQRRLADAQRKGKQHVSHIVVPYEGPQDAHRRPIYLECCREGIVLQPEGIVFTPADLDGAQDPGNALSMALRTARQYLLDRKQLLPDGSDEPYPLLLVRPSGISAYYAAQAAMASSVAAFGCELVEEDWKLDFQPPDAALADKVRQVVDAARARQARVAQAPPSYEDDRSHSKYPPSPYRRGVRDSAELK